MPNLHGTFVPILLSALILISNLKTTTATALPFTPSNLKNFLQNKYHNPLTKNSAIWSYEGRLVDPTNGHVIANVEGIELVRSLAEVSRPQSSQKRDIRKLVWGLRRLNDLKVRTLLAGPGWEYAGTVLSRKLFCYSPVGGIDRGLLKEYKLHPTAPVRKVKTDEAIALYDTATTFISRNGGKEMTVMTEWPDGHWMQSDASCVSFQERDSDDVNDGLDSKDLKPFEFTVYAKRSGKGEVPCLPQTAKKQKRKSGDASSVMGSVPPRSKIVQFGKDNTVEDQRFGARETYAYIMGRRDVSNGNRLRTAFRETLSNFKERVGLWDLGTSAARSRSKSKKSSSTCSVRYTRYGEAPLWYGPGKMCTLELWGRRVDSVADAPPLAATLAATRIPGFLSVHTPIPAGPMGDESYDSKNRNRKRSRSQYEKEAKEQMASDKAAVMAVKWFRGEEGSLPLEVLKNGENEENFINTVVGMGMSFAQRLRSATTATSAAEI